MYGSAFVKKWGYIVLFVYKLLPQKMIWRCSASKPLIYTPTRVVKCIDAQICKHTWDQMASIFQMPIRNISKFFVRKISLKKVDNPQCFLFINKKLSKHLKKK